MKSKVAGAAAVLVVASLISGVGSSVSEVSVNVGDEAPDFELADSAGIVYKLSDFRDKKAVVLEFFRSGDW